MNAAPGPHGGPDRAPDEAGAAPDGAAARQSDLPLARRLAHDGELVDASLRSFQRMWSSAPGRRMPMVSWFDPGQLLRTGLSTLLSTVRANSGSGKSLKEIYRITCDTLRPRFGSFAIFDHCMPFDVTRAADEVGGYRDPRIWTAERDREMWAALEG